MLDRASQNPPSLHRLAVDNVNSSTRPDGNAAPAALRRLRKDRPDLHAEVTMEQGLPPAIHSPAVVNVGHDHAGCVVKNLVDDSVVADAETVEVSGPAELRASRRTRVLRERINARCHALLKWLRKGVELAKGRTVELDLVEHVEALQAALGLDLAPRHGAFFLAPFDHGPRGAGVPQILNPSTVHGGLHAERALWPIRGSFGGHRCSSAWFSVVKPQRKYRSGRCARQYRLSPVSPRRRRRSVSRRRLTDAIPAQRGSY